MNSRTQGSDISIAVAARSGPGLCRDHNEDTFQIIDLARGASLGPPAARGRLVGSVFVLGVYDGCGRGPSGVASDIAAAEILAAMCRGPLPATSEESARLLCGAVIAANRAIVALSARHPLSCMMGTTLTVAALHGDSVIVAHVGDTRAHLLRGERLVQLTRDHTVVEDIRRALERSPDEVDSLPEGTRALLDMTPEQLAELPQNVITRAVGMSDALVVDLARVALCRGDRLLLCTDGLGALVDPAVIAAALRRHPEPVDACDALVEAALRAGGDDNITVLVADVDGEHLQAPLPGQEVPVVDVRGGRSP
ncbi:PP2C family protein-serine/threonine phosphatase [Sorangium sp. So ce341]|uniref:PP2C family protein-serine/threonine phosphatase n=1 Tax=Sorangium sp. So ce341 TaxID=3133302 RepID=UPI003F5FEAA4